MTGIRLAQTDADILRVYPMMRQGAHRFYHRMGLPIASFHFARKL